MAASIGAPYCGRPASPAEIWSSWNLDPVLILLLTAAGIAFGMLSTGPRRRAGLAAIFVLSVAFLSPLCPLTSELFAARSLHHLLVAAVAAPLLACASPARGDAALAPALAVSTITLWLWHWPLAYSAAFYSPTIYWLLQLALLGSFLWFWRAVLSPRGSPVASLLAIGAGAGQMGLLAALLTFAPQPLYAEHLMAPFAWGLDPLVDQQLGGLAMWVPAFFLYGALALLAGRRLARLSAA
jgi:putative membrane protein